MPMTKLTEHLLTEGLSGTEGWRAATASLVQEEHPPDQSDFPGRPGTA